MTERLPFLHGNPYGKGYIDRTFIPALTLWERTALQTGLSRYSFLLFSLLGLAAYGNSLHAPFLFDDLQHIVENEYIRTLWPPWSALFGTQQITRPLVGLTLAINYALGGMEPFSYHLFNLFIHVINAWLLYKITSALVTIGWKEGDARTTDSLALAVAILWLLHPLQTMAVTYTIQRAESMASGFVLFCIYSLIRSHQVNGNSSKWFYLCIASSICGMASKQIAVGIPLALILIERRFYAGDLKIAWRQRKWWFCGTALTGLFIPFSIWLAPKIDGVGTGYTDVTPFRYLITQADVLLYYLRLWLWPYPQSIDYGWPMAASWSQVWWQLLLWTFVVGATIHAIACNRTTGVVLGIFFILLAPSSSIIPLADAAVEHRMYLPSAMLNCLLLAGCISCVQRYSGGSVQVRYIWYITILLALAFLTRTIARNYDYHSTLGMWHRVTQVNPENARGFFNLGVYLVKAESYPEALAAYDRALALRPNYAEAYYNRAHLKLRFNALESALADLAHTLTVDPTFAAAYDLMAGILGMQGHYEDALVQHALALKYAPENPMFYANRAFTRYSMRDFEAARQDLTEYYKLGGKAEQPFMLELDRLEMRP